MDREKQYPTWEILALIIGFVGSASLVPDLVNLAFNFYPNTQEPPTRVFKLICIGLYLLILIIVASRNLYGIHAFHRENNEDNEARFKRIYRRLQILNFIRQFPLSVFNHFVFTLYKVFSYDLFKRHGDWVDRPDLFNLIGRFRIEGKSIELQYPKSFKALLVRETLNGTDTFGVTQEIAWTKSPYRFLSATSWLGLAWTVAHLTYHFKLFFKFILFLGFAYAVGFVLHLLDVLNLRLQFDTMDSIWKTWIIFLLIFDLLASIGLFWKKFWGELLFILVAVVQLIAYTQFKAIFGEQDFLVIFHSACITFYVLLKGLAGWQKAGSKIVYTSSGIQNGN